MRICHHVVQLCKVEAKKILFVYLRVQITINILAIVIMLIIYHHTNKYVITQCLISVNLKEKNPS